MEYHRIGEGNAIKSNKHITGIIILSAFVGLMVFFYVFSVNSASLRLLLIAYLITVGIDALMLGLHIFRHHPPVAAERFDPTKLTILIICYNGADILPETLRQAMKHVPPRQIIVVSDNSSDHTVEVAKAMGARAYANNRNYGKSMSINRHIHRVKTPYVLILDDDTLIGRTFIPTSLLDAGYSAVAFNVLPAPTRSLANYFQQFEYLKSMVIRKGLRTVSASVGNVSGAIGLYHTAALWKQAVLHSGQSGGEDQQRTLLTHLTQQGKGVVYCSSTVYTLAPDSLVKVFKQRAFKWNTAAHENFLLLLRAILHPDTHYMLKIEKTYALFVLLTDPFRMLFFYLILFAPIGSFITHILLIAAFYVVLEIAAWFKTGRENPLWVAILFPLYAKMCAVARFTAHFYWFKKKYVYSLRNHFHRLINGRHLLREYSLVSVLLVMLWSVATYKLYSLLAYSSADASINYSIPMWQPLEWLPVSLSAIELIVSCFVIALMAKYAKAMYQALASLAQWFQQALARRREKTVPTISLARLDANAPRPAKRSTRPGTGRIRALPA